MHTNSISQTGYVDCRFIYSYYEPNKKLLKHTRVLYQSFQCKALDFLKRDSFKEGDTSLCILAKLGLSHFHVFGWFRFTPERNYEVKYGIQKNKDTCYKDRISN